MKQLLAKVSGVPLPALLLSLTLILLACEEPPPAATVAAMRPLELRAGTSFQPVASFEAPAVTRIDLGPTPRMDAVWGATGRDDAGHIYFGVSSKGGEPRTAWLYQYDPQSRVWRQQGDVATELRRAGLAPPGAGQNKLHSKIVPADDGYLYFSSFDEEGETREKNPTWGGHLWRKRPEEGAWEHLLATPEALMAVNTMGRYVYALGYWGHVLYCYDSESGRVVSAEVGSVPGHISRNFLVDANEHAFVPSVRQAPDGSFTAMLHQYDPALNLVARHEMPGYVSSDMSANQGIVAFTALRGDRVAFSAGRGELYLLDSSAPAGARLEHRGKLHPAGASQTTALFSSDGNSLLLGLTRASGSRRWEWLILELNSGVASTFPLTLGFSGDVLLYGSQTKDDGGHFYAAGRVSGAGRPRPEPLLLRLEPR